ncbi:MAG TPA: hypothetical protein VLL52_15230 [Anaerolineae bacterium]|nr:hypothetical protein [Anaerolineae bacterium]
MSVALVGDSLFFEKHTSGSLSYARYATYRFDLLNNVVFLPGVVR